MVAVLLACWWGPCHSVNQVWQSDHQAVQLWSLPGYNLQRATAAAEAFCSGSVHDHRHSAGLSAQFWGVPCCQGSFGPALCLEPGHHVSM